MSTTIFERTEAADATVCKGPHAWIQWKGTDVCADIHCVCGEMTHLDADFAYYVRCGKCGRLYAMCANVRMLPVEEAEVKASGTHEYAIKTSG